MLADLAARYWEHGKRLKPREVVNEYEHTIIDELDLMREAANTAQLKTQLPGLGHVVRPDIHWDYCRPEVLVQERIYGTPISDMAALEAAGADIQRLAENGVEIFFTQVFRHNFFHADMHPGNIFVITTDPDRPKYAAVDFGIVGTLSPSDQRYLAENFLAFSIATITASPGCTLTPAGYHRARVSTNSKLRCARFANRFSTSRWPKFRSHNC